VHKHHRSWFGWQSQIVSFDHPQESLRNLQSQILSFDHLRDSLRNLQVMLSTKRRLEVRPWHKSHLGFLPWRSCLGTWRAPAKMKSTCHPTSLVENSCCNAQIARVTVGIGTVIVDIATQTEPWMEPLPIMRMTYISISPYVFTCDKLNRASFWM
jgi:hypothetical protein